MKAKCVWSEEKTYEVEIMVYAISYYEVRIKLHVLEDKMYILIGS